MSNLTKNMSGWSSSVICVNLLHPVGKPRKNQETPRKTKENPRKFQGNLKENLRKTNSKPLKGSGQINLWGGTQDTDFCKGFSKEMFPTSPKTKRKNWKVSGKSTGNLLPEREIYR